MRPSAATGVVVPVLATLAALPGCSLLFPFDPSPADVGAPGHLDASTDAKAGVDAAAPPDAGRDAAAEPDGPACDGDGDGSPCGVDCDDADPLRYPGAPWATFSVEPIAGTASDEFDAVVQPNGALAVLFSAGGGAVELATNDGGGWFGEVVASADHGAEDVALAAGAEGFFAGCWWDELDDSGPLVVWNNATGETLHLAEDVGPRPWCSVIAGSGATAHVVFYDDASGELRYSQLAMEEWSPPQSLARAWTQRPDTYWSRPAIAATAGGAPLVVFRDEDTSRLVVLQEAGGDWSPLELTYEARMPAVLVRGQSLHLCFRGTEQDQVGYGVCDLDGTCSAPSLFGGDVDAFCSLALVDAGAVVAWQEEPADEQYETWIARSSSEPAWQPEVLVTDLAGAEPRRPELLVGPDGELQVVFQDEASDWLMLGVLHPGCP